MKTKTLEQIKADVFAVARELRKAKMHAWADELIMVADDLQQLIAAVGVIRNITGGM